MTANKIEVTRGDGGKRLRFIQGARVAVEVLPAPGMVYLAVDSDGSGFLYAEPPKYDGFMWRAKPGTPTCFCGQFEETTPGQARQQIFRLPKQ